MYSDVYKHCRACLNFQPIEEVAGGHAPPLMPIEVGGLFEGVGVDILKMPVTDSGNCYVGRVCGLPDGSGSSPSLARPDYC